LKLGPAPGHSALNLLVDAADKAEPSPIEVPIEEVVVVLTAASASSGPGSAMPASDQDPLLPSAMPAESEEGTPGRQWKEAIRKGASNVFARLQIREKKLQDSAAILKRIHDGIDGDKKDATAMPMHRECFLVHRKGGTSPFQVNVMASRILAHHVLCAACNELGKERMDLMSKGALQVRQS
jgi:hypothetical protein